MMTDKIKSEDTVEYYNNFSLRYDTERSKGYFEFINNLEIEMIAPLAAGKKVLEIGCGTGLILERVDAFSSEAHGVDISEGMLEACKSKGLNVSLGSATDLPFEDASFDFCYSFKVLPHVPDIRKALLEIARVTRPGGRMVLEFYNPWSFKALGDWVRKGLRRRNLVYLRHDSPKTISKMLPSSTILVRTRGIRIFGPTAKWYTIPIIGCIIRELDRLACDGPLKVFGGYFVVELAVINGGL
jgi:ubiquinone/menaquinone biosynthesis C-methylase UbiE